MEANNYMVTSSSEALFFMSQLLSKHLKHTNIFECPAEHPLVACPFYQIVKSRVTLEPCSAKQEMPRVFESVTLYKGWIVHYWPTHRKCDR